MTLWAELLGRLLIIGALAILPYAAIRAAWRRRRKARRNILRELLLAIFILFSTGLVILIFWPRTGAPGGSGLAGAAAPSISGIIENAKARIRSMRGINLIPFASIRGYFRHTASEQFLVNIVGNIAVFVPFGFFPPLLWRRWRKPRNVFLYGLALPVLIEFVQLFNGRSVDIDDIILNFSGAAMGCLLYNVLKLILPKFIRRLVE